MICCFLSLLTAKVVELIHEEEIHTATRRKRRTAMVVEVLGPFFMGDLQSFVADMSLKNPEFCMLPVDDDFLRPSYAFSFSGCRQIEEGEVVTMEVGFE